MSSSGENVSDGRRFRFGSNRRSSVGRARNGAEEALHPQTDSQDDNWGENTTCVTGNTSERSYSGDELRQLRVAVALDKKPAPVRMLCLRHVWLLLALVISVLSVASPVVMVLLPKAFGGLLGNSSAPWPTSTCTAACEGLLISFAVKLLILVAGVWALFLRRALADLPRLFLARASILAFVFLITFSYWLFYGVRVVQKRESDYTAIVTFALSLVDALLFTHYLAVIVLQLRQLRPEFRVRVVRSPDGESRAYSLGHQSIQSAAVAVLQNYYRDFPVYNPYLERLPAGSNRMKLKGSQVSAPTGLKLYKLDGSGGPDSTADINTQALMVAAARKRDSSHNERFYEELDWERRVRKRRARLMTAAEEAFGHIKRLHDDKGGTTVSMDAQEAAQAIFPALARTLQKYLRVTRQQPRHTAEQVVRHLAQYVSFDMSPRSFLERFFSNAETIEASTGRAEWSMACDQLVSRSLCHGTMFVLRCHAEGADGGVQLLCTASSLPFFNLTEEVIDVANDRFVFRLSSETSV